MSTFIRGISGLAKGFAVGSADVEKMYLGSTKIYDKSGYVSEVEYLKSTGTQYIDTLIAVSTSHEIRAIFMADGTSQNNNAYMYFGQGVAYNDKNIELFSANNGSYLSCLCYGYRDVTAPAYSSKFSVVFKNKVFTIKNSSGTTIATADFSSTSNFTASYTMAIFALHRSSYLLSSKPVRCYSFQILDANENFVLDMIPVRVGQVGYMYDKVSGQLFGNAGTGNFILGPDVQ